MINYIEFAYKTYKEHIFPLIQNASLYKNDILETNPLIKEAIEYCKYEEELSGRRFYPSSLFIAFYAAFSGREPNKQHYQIAAALELFHNSSLCHDDVLDNHMSRREKPTIVKTYNSNTSILVGNTMLAMMNSFLDKLSHEETHAIRSEFTRSQIHLNYGQYLDENVVWKNVNQNKWRQHWDKILNYKMTVGFIAVRLAAILAGKKDSLDLVNKYEYNMSVVSQIINDTGDLYKFYGYYMTTKTIREAGEEITQKATYPLIWAIENEISYNVKKLKDIDIDKLKSLLGKKGFYQSAQSEITLLKQEALVHIEKLIIPSEYANIIIDFTNKPKLPNNPEE